MKYNVYVNGTCLESKYYPIDYATREFWEENIYDELLNDYLWGDADLNDIPENARFLGDEPDDYYCDTVSIVIDPTACIVSVSPVDEAPPVDDFDIEDENIVSLDVDEFNDDLYLVVSEIYKGTIYGGEIEIDEPFDKSKLKIHLSKDLEGEPSLAYMTYDGVDIDNTEMELMESKGRSVFIIEK